MREEAGAPQERRLEHLSWGEEGTPLLPLAVRDLSGDERVPVQFVHRGEQLTVSDLSAAGWSRLRAWTPAFERFLLGVVRYPPKFGADVPFLGQDFPTTLTVGGLPLSRRTMNALSRSGLADNPIGLAAATLAELRGLAGLGDRGIVELAVIAEAVLDNAAQSNPLEAELRLAVARVMESEWSSQVVRDDPRFARLIPDVPTTIRRYLDRLWAGTPSEHRRSRSFATYRLGGVQDRIREIDEFTLDEALDDFVVACGLSEDQRRVVMAHLGWAGLAPVPLESAGRVAPEPGVEGVSRQYVHQLETKVRTKAAAGKLFLPALDRALHEISVSGHLSNAEVSALLRARGLSKVEMTIEALSEAALTFGRDFPARHIAPRQSFVVAIGSGPSPGAVAGAARKASSRTGMAHVQSVAERLGLSGEHSLDEIRRLVGQSTHAQFADDDWFWIPSSSQVRNVLHTTTKQMLCVNSPLTLRTIREGLRRRFKQRRLGPVPPASALKVFYSNSDTYRVVGDELEAAAPLECGTLLTGSSRKMADVLRSAPGQMMTRAEFARACRSAGVPAATFNHYTTFSPILDHPAEDTWTLRGNPFSRPIVGEGSPQRARGQRIVAYGWHERGEVWAAWRLPVAPSQVVLGVPAKIGRRVTGRRFQGLDEDGQAVADIGVNENGLSWGYGPYLRRVGGEEGDVLKAVFNLRSATAKLSLENEEILLPENVRLAAGGITIDYSALVRELEGLHLERKETARVNNETGEFHKGVEVSWIKTIGGFLNAEGGTLLIGVNNDGVPKGLGLDFRYMGGGDEDQFELYVRERIETHLSKKPGSEVTIAFPAVGGVQICAVTVAGSPEPVFFSEGEKETFYVRSGNKTDQLPPSQMIKYIRRHWPN